MRSSITFHFANCNENGQFKEDDIGRTQHEFRDQKWIYDIGGKAKMNETILKNRGWKI
jgi:hypothetical protein